MKTFLQRSGLCLLTLCSIRLSSQAIDQDLQRKLVDILKLTQAIQPGMTRRDVLVVFKTEGGLSTRDWNHYVLRTCPLIKLDINFDIPRASALGRELPTDVIKTVSKPYLEYGIYD